MKKILVVDDDPDYLEMLSAFLLEQNYDVISASDGSMAEVEFHRQNPDLVISDVLMPEEDGVELLMNLKINGKLPCPFIVMSGGGIHDGEGYLRISKKLGADAIFKKPFPLRNLAKQIELLLN